MLSRVSRVRPALARILAPQTRVLAPAHTRPVSQSRPNGATSAAATEAHAPPASVEHGEVSQYTKNPDYHGFSADPVVDEWNMRIGFFFGISVALVIGGTFIHYLPDHGMRQWARREAERVLVQRERDGLPLIGENYYDPNAIVLPTKDQ
ncbi:unnamed protein product [Knipowitschia caucasica]